MNYDEEELQNRRVGIRGNMCIEPDEAFYYLSKEPLLTSVKPRLHVSRSTTAGTSFITVQNRCIPPTHTHWLVSQEVPSEDDLGRRRRSARLANRCASHGAGPVLQPVFESLRSRPWAVRSPG